jgi:hypothetical protein
MQLVSMAQELLKHKNEVKRYEDLVSGQKEQIAYLKRELKSVQRGGASPNGGLA